MGSIEVFDEYADAYDAWFLENRQVLGSELLLLRRAIGEPGRALSVGCGSGLFESLLQREHGVLIGFGVEPAEGMARIAEKRGLSVKSGVAEALPYGDGEFDTVIQNGTPGYTKDLAQAFREALRVLRSGGHLVVLDVPAESSYGLLYRLATVLGSWKDPRLAGSAPAHPYPIEFAAAAHWRTTEEKAALLRESGFADLQFFQTLTRHPRYSDDAVEEPSEGFDRGDYVAIRARKP
jgi:ubiquinone/menaquinone biosynthesis C-methylase UbiE